MLTLGSLRVIVTAHDLDAGVPGRAGADASHDAIAAGLGVRLAGAVVAVAGASRQICLDECGPRDNTGPAVLIGLGLTAYAAGVTWDIIAAPSTAREANARRHPTITPTVMTAPSGSPAYGLGLGGSF
jgi:hypothetical protein